MFRHVIFDLDGTLLNTLDDLADAGNYVCAANGWPVFPVDAYRQMVGRGIPNLCRAFSPETARSPEQLEQTLAAFSARYAAHKFDKTAPYPGIPALLRQLKAAGVGTAVFSNKEDSFTRAIIARYFGDAIGVVRGSRPGVPIKPAPDGIYPILEALGAGVTDTLYVGDSNVDVETAHNAHLPCCGVLWGFRGEAELTAAGADYLAADTQALAARILG